MAKKKAKTSSKKHRLGSPSEWSYAKWAVFLVLLGTAVYLLFGYLPAERARDAERKEFAKNKAQIEEIAAKITAQYPPSEEKHSESCRYQSAKFDKGDLYCYVGVELKYQSIDITRANEIAINSAMQSGLELMPAQSLREREKNFTPSEDLNDRQGLLADFAPRGCSAAFYYDTGSNSSRELSVFLSCNRVSKAEYFPLEKY